MGTVACGSTPSGERETAGSTQATGGSSADVTSTAGPGGDATTSAGPTTSTGGTATTDPGTDGSTGGGQPSAAWLLTIDDGASPTRLMRVDAGTGAATSVCQLPAGSVYNSLTFARDGMLFAHNQSQLRIESINPCTCAFQIVGPTSADNVQITADAATGLDGIELTSDIYVDVDRGSGLATLVGPLGIDFGDAGVSWSDTMLAPLAVDSTSDSLYRIDPGTGVATVVVALDVDMVTVGMEIQPATGDIYACSADTLYMINGTTGQAQAIGDLGLVGPCDNLAAPWTAIACLD